MENQINVGDQYTQQVERNPTSQPVQISEKPKVNYRMISTLLLLILFFGLLGFYVFSQYQNNQSGSGITPTTQPSLSEFACSRDNDCVIGIQATSCCSCPKAINKELVGTDDWEQYESGKDYSSQQTKSCGGQVNCKPCEFPETTVCFSDKCQFPNHINIQPPDAQKQNVGVFVRLKKITYSPGEPIAFTIANNIQQNVYYLPETCASSLVQIFIIPENNSTPMQGDQKMCLLAPAVETLLPNGNITSKIPDKTLSKMVPGRYKIKFYYSLEKRDRFGLGEQSIVESEILTISE